MLRSPAGETRESTRFPFDQEQLQRRLGALRETLVRARGGRDVVAAPAEARESGQQAVRDFGRVLFEVLFTGEVGNLYSESLREARRKPDRGLRIKLRTPAPELAVLPWEFLHDQRRGDFICLSKATPLMRYLELPHPPEALAVTAPLRILGMIASPSDLPALDVARERQRMEEALADSRGAGLVDITWLEGQTWQALQQAMGRGGGGPWHVFHFIGHGGFNPRTSEGHIALVGEDGRSTEFTATQLGRLLGDCQTLRLAVLNACEGARGSGADLFSSTAAILVRHGLPAVVSMQQEISDQAAIQFAKEFYRTLALEYPVDAAVAEARKAMSFALPDSVEWGTPVLHLRSPDGRLFRVGGRTSGDTAPGLVAPEAMAPSASTRLSRRGLQVLTLVQMVGTVAGLVVPWIVNAAAGETRVNDLTVGERFSGSMALFWVYLSITGAVLGWLGLRRSTWSGVLLGGVAPTFLSWNILARIPAVFTSARMVASGLLMVLAIVSGVTLLRRLPPAGPMQRASLPKARVWAFGFWTCGQTVAIFAAMLLALTTEGWSVVVLSGAVLGLVGLSYEVWPAVLLGWSSAAMSAPFLTNLQLKSLGRDSPSVYLFLWLYLGLAFVLCAWTLIALRRRRSLGA